MIAPETVAKLRSYFGQWQEVIAVYLFGSKVKGMDRKTSDLDIAVLFCSHWDSIRRFDAKLQITDDLEKLLPTPIDVVDVRNADPFFLHQIMLHKLLIFENGAHERVEFEVKARKEYFDRASFYRLYHEQARKRLQRRVHNG